MSKLVVKINSFPTRKKRSKSLADLSRELSEMTHPKKLTLVSGAIFRMHQKKKLCGNIVPQ